MSWLLLLLLLVVVVVVVVVMVMGCGGVESPVCVIGYNARTPKGLLAEYPANNGQPEKTTAFTNDNCCNANDATNVPIE